MGTSQCLRLTTAVCTDVNPLYPSGTAYASLGNVLFRAFSTANFALHPQVSERRANFGGGGGDGVTP